MQLVDRNGVSKYWNTLKHEHCLTYKKQFVFPVDATCKSYTI